MRPIILTVTQKRGDRLTDGGPIPVKIVVGKRISNARKREIHGLLTLQDPGTRVMTGEDQQGRPEAIVVESDVAGPTDVYNQWVKRVIDVIGHDGTTTAEELLTAASKLPISGLLAGVYAADETAKTSRKKPYAIINTETPPGEHWIGLVNDKRRVPMAYDSFGRSVMKVSKQGDLIPIHTDPDAEQRHDEKNCGQRCLAWLCVVQELGIDAARDI